MTSKRIWSAAVILVLGTTNHAVASSETGRQIAERWCQQCHVISPDASSATDAAPAFASVANDPAWTDGALRSWLSAPHDPMPDLSLEKEEIEAIIAYLRSL